MPSYVKVHPIHGLNTRANEDGLPEPEATIAQNCRFGSGGFERRLGSVRVLRATSTEQCLDFDAASTEYITVPIDTRVWGLGTKFTIETLGTVDDVSVPRTIFHAGDGTLSIALVINSGNWVFAIRDSAAAATNVTVGAVTLGLVTSIQLVRDGTSLTSRINNVAGGAGTMSALPLQTPVGNLMIGGVGVVNPHDGKIDYIRVFSIVKANHNDRLVRFPDPRAEYVMADYGFTMSGTTVYDNSRFENHGIAVNTPTPATALCHNSAPVRAISAYTNYSRQKRVLIQAGSALHDVPVP